MDVEMPEMDGLEATAVIRVREKQTGEHIPIVAMTAHAMKGDRERCLDAGMDGYLSKPIRSRQLFETLASVLGTATIPAGDATSGEGGIDWTQMLDFVEGDVDLMKTIAETAANEVPRMLQAVRSAVESDDAEALRRAAHTLEGSIRSFGHSAAFDCALKLEQLGANGDLREARSALIALEKAMAEFLRDLSEYGENPVQDLG
jgi:CheY-like chemotaxis protein